MAELSLEANTVSYSSAIGACAEGSQWAPALYVLDQMARTGLQANCITYYAAMHACEACGQWSLTLAVLAAMLEAGVQDRTQVRVKYVHQIQAGGPADCFKHVVLGLLLQQLLVAGEPLTYVDTHAGGGIYDLTSDDTMSPDNFEEGILRLDRQRNNEADFPVPIAQYMSAVDACNQALTGSIGRALKYYAGSPALALHWLRPQDSATLFETSEAVHAKLQQNVALIDPSAAVTVLQEDSYRWLLSEAALPLFSGRVPF
ncbi:unnamed protein product [Polarella glacialis]|uniref:Uncharacterized protein n=1 Tax=Polarella glacialis TaxID=89957 RepID=A0A813J9P9_POLGL|nr:unnamed protein product [Polarella glacialis]